jgi:hypothetical protein
VRATKSTRLLPAGIAEGAAGKSHPYRTRWKHDTVGKAALGHVAAGAGVSQLRKTPRKYGGGGSGFGKRLGTGFAANAVKTTVEHGVAARLHKDLNYHRSTKHGVAPRLAQALTSTVVTRNTKTGKRTPAAGAPDRTRSGGRVHTGSAGRRKWSLHGRHRTSGRGGRQRRARVRAAPQSPSPQEEVMQGHPQNAGPG